MRSAGAICGSLPACVLWLLGTAENEKGRCMLWLRPDVEFGHSCGTDPGADAGKLSWVQQAWALHWAEAVIAFHSYSA